MDRAQTRRLVARIASAVALAVAAFGVSLVVAPPAQAVTICEQFGTVVAGNYVIMNNRWGSSAPQCINTTSNGFTITQQDGTGNLSGAPVSYPAIYLGCHYTNCSPSSPLPAQISTMGNVNTSISLSYPSGGTWNAAYDIWINADTNTTGVQDTEIMIWLNRQGSIQPIGSNTGTVTLAGRSWQVWVGSNGQNNVVSYLSSSIPITSISFNARDFILDAVTRGSGFGSTSWYLTSVQAGFEPWISGVGLTVNSFSASIGGGNPTQPPGTPGTPTTSNVTSSSVSLNWAASSGTVSSYQIERATGASSTSFTQVGTSASPSFNDSGLAANTTYRYRVRATNSAGNSAYSGIVNVTTTGGTPQVPGTPGTPTTSGVTSSSVTLNWSASSGTVTNYQIERATGASSTSFTQVGTSTSTSFTNTGLSASTTYRYRVRATNSAGNSAYSGIVNVTTSGGGSSGCTYRFDQWDTGYVAYVTVNGPTSGWSIPFTLGADNTIANSWNATISGTGTSRTATNVSHNGNLAAGQSTQWGFQASRPSGGALPSFTGCTAQ